MHIRQMIEKDIDFAFACTQAEKWAGETRDVFEIFFKHNPQGCFVAEIDGERMGICVATGYRQHGFVGELIITPPWRGQGHGTRLFDHAVRALQASGIPNAYLDGALDAVPIYERYGFVKICPSLRFLGKLPGQDHPSIRPMTPADLAVIAPQDTHLFGDDRGAFLRLRLESLPGHAVVQDGPNGIVGYAMARPGVGVLQVGPVAVWGDGADPLALIEALALKAQGSPIRLGVLESNPQAAALFRGDSRFEEQKPCWRMVLGGSPRLGAHHGLFSVGSAAKG